MSTLMEELTAIKTVEDKITANKVANFAYTDTAYNDPANYADGVATYDPDAEQNIPVANASTLKVNATILTKGWRAQASAITRMLMNHFLGRCSYNLNKVNDLFSLLLAKLMAFMGQPNGLATLDSYGRSPNAVGSNKVYITRGFLGAIFGRLLCRKLTRSLGDNSTVTVNALAYANGLWVCGTSAGIWYSEDNGKNWVQVDTEITESYSSIFYVNGLWLAQTNNSNHTYWSEDGKLWTISDNSIDTNSINDVSYKADIWVAVTNSGAWWSEDGKSWTLGTGIANTVTVLSLQYANNVWVCPTALRGVFWSEDGKSWTQGTGIASTYSCNVVKYANGLWVCGLKVWGVRWSEDGKSWIRGTGLIDKAVNCIVFANGIWLCGGEGTFWSEDGKSWTQGTGLTTSDTVRFMDYANGIWVCATVSHGIFWSKDGKAWNSVSVTSSYTMQYLAYANGLWICGSESHGIWWSENGKDWEQALGATSYTIQCIVYAQGAWIAGTNSHGLLHSTIDDLIADGTIDLGADIPLVNA